MSLFNSFWEDVSQLYNDDSEADFHCAQVSCVESPEICKTENIQRPLEIRFYSGKNSDFNPEKVQIFIQGIIDKYVTEFENQLKMISKLETKKHLLFFSKPDCPNCLAFKPIWVKLSEIHKNSTKYSLININCPDFGSICDHFKVEHYPVVAYSENYYQFKIYKGGDHVTSLSLFLRKNARDKTKKVFKYPSGLLQLDGDTIFDVLEKDLTFVQFELPGCHYCDVSSNIIHFYLFNSIFNHFFQEHNKTMHRLARHFSEDPTIKVAKMNCGKTLALCRELNAKVYPFFNVYKNNNLVKRDYHETMTFKGFHDCIQAFKVGGACKKLNLKLMIRLFSHFRDQFFF